MSVEDAISEILKIYRGVPQGSCISSLLFIFLLSTLPKSTIKPVKSKEFADDVCYSITAETKELAESQMQDAIDKFINWTKQKGLTINKSKTKALCFTQNRKEEDKKTHLWLENEEIELVSSFC